MKNYTQIEKVIDYTYDNVVSREEAVEVIEALLSKFGTVETLEALKQQLRG